MKTVIILQARLGSTRLKNKLFLKLKGKTILEHILLRLKLAKEIDEIIVAVPKKDYKRISKKIEQYKFAKVMWGAEEDVLSRYYKIASKVFADTIIRATADNPLVDILHLEKALQSHIRTGADYTTFLGLPLGCGIEVISMSALRMANRKAKKRYEREHITQYIINHPLNFKLNYLKPKKQYIKKDLRLTVDTKEDFEFIKTIYEKLDADSLLNLNKILKQLKFISKSH